MHFQDSFPIITFPYFSALKLREKNYMDYVFKKIPELWMLYFTCGLVTVLRPENTSKIHGSVAASSFLRRGMLIKFPARISFPNPLCCIDHCGGSKLRLTHLHSNGNPG